MHNIKHIMEGNKQMCFAMSKEYLFFPTVLSYLLAHLHDCLFVYLFI